MNMSTNNRPIAACRGMTLVEVLVAVLVFAVGLLGIAGLQVVAKKTNYDAVQRTTASMLVQDMVERMRANDEALDAYVSSEVGRGQTGNEPSPNCRHGTPCTAAQLAVHDLWEWEQALDGAAELQGAETTGGLSQPTGCVSGPTSGGAGDYTVTVVWRGLRRGTNPTASSCGEDPDLYGSDNEFRRMVSLQVFISPRGN